MSTRYIHKGRVNLNRMTFEEKWKQLYEDHKLSAEINGELDEIQPEIALIEAK